MTTLKVAITRLETHRKELLSQLRETDKALSVLRGLKKGGMRVGLHRRISAAGRARIVAAQKARCAKFRKALKKK